MALFNGGGGGGQPQRGSHLDSIIWTERGNTHPKFNYVDPPLLLAFISLLIEFSGQWKHVIDIKNDKVNLESAMLNL